MYSQLGYLTLIVLTSFAALSNMCGCTNPSSTKTSVDEMIVEQIIRDIDLPERDTDVVQLTAEGDRDVAIVRTVAKGRYILRCVYRARDKGDLNANGWKLWINYEIIDDGTGAEVLGMREYTEPPNAESVAAFKSDILKHWSNR